MENSKKQRLFTTVSNEEVKNLQEEAKKKKEEAKMGVYFDAINSIRIKEEEGKCLFTTISDEEVEEIKRMAEETGKKVEEEVYRKALGISQTDGGFSSYSAGAVLAVEADRKTEIQEKENIGVNHQAEEKKQTVRLFEYLRDEKAEKNNCNQNVSVKDLCPESIPPCMLRKASSQEGDALSDGETAGKSQKREEKLPNKEETLSEPSEKKIVKEEADSKKLKCKKTENKETDKVQLSHLITEKDRLSSANFSLRLIGTVDEITELVGKNVVKKFYIFGISMQHEQFEVKVATNELEKFTWLRNATNGRAFCREKKDYMDFSLHIHEIIERDIKNPKVV